jgi:hypothetical protein
VLRKNKFLILTLLVYVYIFDASHCLHYSYDSPLKEHRPLRSLPGKIVQKGRKKMTGLKCFDDLNFMTVVFDQQKSYLTGKSPKYVRLNTSSKKIEDYKQLSFIFLTCLVPILGLTFQRLAGTYSTVNFKIMVNFKKMRGRLENAVRR